MDSGITVCWHNQTGNDLGTGGVYYRKPARASRPQTRPLSPRGLTRAPHAEGVPRALIQAAMAKPIVCSDLPGCREIVYNGRNGFLVPLQDPKALCDAIQSPVQDPDLRTRMGAEGRAIGLDNYTDEIVNGKILRVYNELLERIGLPEIAGGTT